MTTLRRHQSLCFKLRYGYTSVWENVCSYSKNHVFICK